MCSLDGMSLGEKDRRLVRLIVAIALGRWDELSLLRESAPLGEPDREWREVVLMAHLFAGIPRQVEAYEVLDKHGGLGVLEEGEDRSEDDVRARGEALFDRIYGTNAASVRPRLYSFHPDFGKWVQEHAYGRVLSRPGLTADRRELCAIGALASLGQSRQLASHVRGAALCGATREQIEGVLDAIADLLTPERILRARTVIERFVSFAPQA
jgi:alkylhydroperoxidase/carboxymuconolactone decarboxylase family protein YurZ